jgi:3-dehydroquinate synthase
LETRVFFLSPAHVARLALPRVTPSLDERSVPWSVIHVEDGDEHKTMQQVERIVGELAEAGASRDTVAVTVGGGVTGDIGGFAASMYMRGLPFVQIPTSLLAQVDASIGGKVGVNHARAKNLVGATYQPHLVLTDPALLDTLPEREFSNGMAEAIKTAIVGDPGLFERLAQTPGPVIDDVVAACVRVKARVVEGDPFERDSRRVLNLGHTLGHALEAALSYRGLPHGAAVGLGLLAAWRIAVARGVAEPVWLERTRELLGRFGLPTEAPAVDEASLRAALQLDKKRRAGGLTFVLPLRPGRVEIVDDVAERELVAALHD